VLARTRQKAIIAAAARGWMAGRTRNEFPLVVLVADGLRQAVQMNMNEVHGKPRLGDLGGERV